MPRLAPVNLFYLMSRLTPVHLFYLLTRFVPIHFLYLISRLVPVHGTLATTHLLVIHVGPCDDNEKLPMTLQEFTISTHTVDSTLSGEFNLTEDVANGWKVKATTQKCQDIRNVDTCDFFEEFMVVNDGCSEDNDEEEETYGMLLHYADPEIECPIRAGVYKLNNYPFFTQDNFQTVHEAKISTSMFGYTFRLDGFSVDGRKIFCVETYLQLQYIREHNWLERPHNDTERTSTHVP